jgi:hypothetical protein
LEDGPPRFPQGFSGPVVLRDLLARPVAFRLRGYHPLWPHFPVGSSTRWFCNSLGVPPHSLKRPYNPECTTPVGLHTLGLGCSPFARHYLGNLCLISLPEGTEMFHFPSFTLCGLWIHPQSSEILLAVGYPIRESPDRRLLAAPRSLSQLTTPFVVSWRQGIHRVPLVA